MKLLAIDTSSTACSIALLANNKIYSVHDIAPMQQAQTILPKIDVLLANANISLTELDALAFGVGPGSFTGVRIATSVMQGLSYALQIPLIPVSSLAALAQAAYEELTWEKLIVAVDARIQEVYWAAYQVNAAGLVELREQEVVCAPSDILLPDAENWYGVGNAWSVYHEHIPVQPIKIDATRMPMANAILSLAKIKFQHGEMVCAEEVVPTYLRDNVAKKSFIKE